MRPLIYLSAAAILWGLNFHLLKVMLATVDFPEAGFWGYLFAVLFMTIFLVKNPISFRKLKAHIMPLLLIGFVGIFCFNMLLFWGLMYTSPLNASLIISLNPIFTLLLSSVIFQMRIGSWQWVGSILSIFGILFLLSQGEIMDLSGLLFSIGDLMVLLASVFAACYHIWVKKFGTSIPNMHFTFVTNFVCFLCFTCILPFTASAMPYDYRVGFWIAAVVFGTLGTTLTYILWNKGVKLVGPDKAGIFMNLVPLSTAAFSLITGEEINFYHWVSGTMIIMGLMISNLSEVIISKILNIKS